MFVRAVIWIILPLRGAGAFVGVSFPRVSPWANVLPSRWDGYPLLDGLFPAGAKAQHHLIVLSARLKSCPDAFRILNFVCGSIE
jgi:hypothetical protein